jgi:hypothetical protein
VLYSAVLYSGTLVAAVADRGSQLAESHKRQAQIVSLGSARARALPEN